MRAMLIACGALLVAGCSEEAPTNNVVEAAPASIPAGEYEVTTTVASFRSTDGSTPIVQAKQGDTGTSRACVGSDGAPAPELFAAKGDVCTSQNGYTRNGRLNMTLKCKREGASGDIMTEVSGSYTADSMKGSVTTISSLYGKGDYELHQDFTARRVGECKAGGTPS